MKTICNPSIYFAIVSVVNIAIIIIAIVLYHRHMMSEIAKQKRRLERRRGKIFDPVTRGGGYQPYPTKNENKCNPPRKP